MLVGEPCLILLRSSRIVSSITAFSVGVGSDSSSKLTLMELSNCLKDLLGEFWVVDVEIVSSLRVLASLRVAVDS